MTIIHIHIQCNAIGPFNSYMIHCYIGLLVFSLTKLTCAYFQLPHCGRLQLQLSKNPLWQNHSKIKQQQMLPSPPPIFYSWNENETESLSFFRGSPFLKASENGLCVIRSSAGVCAVITLSKCIRTDWMPFHSVRMTLHTWVILIPRWSCACVCITGQQNMRKMPSKQRAILSITVQHGWTVDTPISFTLLIRCVFPLSLTISRTCIHSNNNRLLLL